MPFNLNIPDRNQENISVDLEVGEMIFVLGANGVGKSSLLSRFAQQNHPFSRKIAAHRQTWMNSDALDMTPSNKINSENSIRNADQQLTSRYRDSHASMRASMTIYELIDAENVRARFITAAVDANDTDAIREAAKVQAPIKIINELLLQSNIPIVVTIEKNERIMARKNDGQPYSAAELSDGERNALLIAGDVLTAPPGTLIIIDEPERHLLDLSSHRC
jgi:ABC-type cobalamin/Fe3+-siderophores transport system ATPase subunit